MLEKLFKCNNCNLCNNQKPLLDRICECDVMWVGLSAKKVDDINKSIPLDVDTNSGSILEQIENKLPNIKFYKTNLVKCLPLDELFKLRYPTNIEMYSCIDNLILEINFLKPKIIFILGKKNYNFIYKNFQKRNINTNNIIYIKHPSYIFVYKKKYIKQYIDEVVNICNDLIIKGCFSITNVENN